MDGRTTYAKLDKILSPGIIHLSELRKKLIIEVGSDERTIYKCLKILSETGRIKDIGDNKVEVL
jgi:hypothetical protein